MTIENVIAGFIVSVIAAGLLAGYLAVTFFLGILFRPILSSFGLKISGFFTEMFIVLVSGNIWLWALAWCFNEIGNIILK